MDSSVCKRNLDTKTSIVCILTIVLEWELTSVIATTIGVLYSTQWLHRSLGNCILNIFSYYHRETQREVLAYVCTINVQYILWQNMLKCDNVQNILTLYVKWISPNTVTVLQSTVLYISECRSLYVNYGVGVVWSNGAVVQCHLWSNVIRSRVVKLFSGETHDIGYME